MCDTMGSNPAVPKRSRSARTSPVRRTPPNSRSNSFKKGVRGLLMKSFSFSLQKSRRSLTPMRRSGSSVSTDQSISSGDQDQQQRSSQEMDAMFRVRFHRNPNSKKIKKQVYEFERVTEDEHQLYWYTDVDMLDIMDDVKHTVKQYLKKCERYRVAMEKIADKCADASPERESITCKLDPKVLHQIADAAARGVEQHVSPRQLFTRQEIMTQVLKLQDYSGSPENAQLIATKYAELCKTARLVAKTMGDGDALVAEQILQRKSKPQEEEEEEREEKEKEEEAPVASTGTSAEV